MSKYLERVSNGLCGRCGKSSETRSCDDCRTRVARNNKKYKKQNLENGLCRHCKNKATNGQYCQKHWQSGIGSRYEKRYGIPFEKLLSMFNEQGGKCAYSDLELVLGKNAELDHIVAKSKGGCNNVENVQWVHQKVNRMKGDLSEAEFKELCKLVTTK